MIGIIGSHQGRTLDAQQDMSGMGRWSYVCLDGNDQKIFIVSAYQVAQESNDGIHTAYIQQYRLMKEKGISNPNPRKQWCIDMLQQITKWKCKGEILLLTDANSALGEKDFGDFVAQAGLFDLLGAAHGISGINSHINGSKRIVFALGTRGIMQALTKSGMRPFHSELVSDHRGMFLELNLLTLF